MREVGEKLYTLCYSVTVRSFSLSKAAGPIKHRVADWPNESG